MKAGVFAFLTFVAAFLFSGSVGSAASPEGGVCPGGIAYGETVTCAIVADETDSFTFAGNTNDRVIVRLQVSSGHFDPDLQIDAPGGSMLCEDATIFTLLELNCTLTSDGNHTVHVAGTTGQNGSYNLHLQRSNDPADQTAIAYGETPTDDISIAPEMNVFAFSGNVGDQVIIRIQITSGSLDPGLRIYRPDGSALCSDDTIFDLLELNCTLVDDGGHTIFVHGGDGQTGSYNLHLQRSNDPADQTAMAYGQTLNGDIAVAPEMDVFAFDGNSGDRVIVRMQITSGALDPGLRIYRPGGTALCTDDTIFGLLEINCLLVDDGLHMIFAHGGSGQTGSYNLHLQRSSDPANQTAMAYGESLNGHVTVAPEMDVFAFDGSAGDRVIVRMQITTNALDPHLRIYRPDGSQLCGDNTIFNLLELNCVLVDDGVHTIFAHGGDGQIGSYNLHLQRGNEPANVSSIAYGRTYRGNITVAPEVDVFGFETEAEAGDTLFVHLRMLTQELDPNMRVYDVGGTVICAADTIFDELNMNCSVPLTGVYTVFVFGGDNQTGAYELCVDRNLGRCYYPVFLPAFGR